MAISDTMNRMLALLADQGKSQKALCAHIGITEQLFSDWKGGRKKSYPKYIPQIADFFDCSVDYLLGRVSNPKAMYFPLDDLESAPDDALIETGFAVKKKDAAKVMRAADELGLAYSVSETKKAPADSEEPTGERELPSARLVQAWMLTKLYDEFKRSKGPIIWVLEHGKWEYENVLNVLIEEGLIHIMGSGNKFAVMLTDQGLATMRKVELVEASLEKRMPET